MSRSATASGRRADGAVVLTEACRFDVLDVAPPVPAPGEVLIHVVETGLCGSDVTMYLGKHPVNRPPLTLGHEFYGVLLADSPGSALHEGDLVAVFPALSCGSCPACAAGRANVCPDMGIVGAQRPGALAGVVAVAQAGVVPLDPGIPAGLRVLVEPMAVATHAVRRAGNVRDQRCAVIGAGPIGSLVAMLLRHYGAREVLVADPDERRREIITKLRVGTAVRSRRSLHETFGDSNGTFDTIFDCVGNRTVAQEALSAVHAGGAVVLVGVQSGALQFDGVALQRGERSVIGVQLYTRADFDHGMEMLANVPGLRDLPSDELIRRNPVRDVSTVFARMAAGKSAHLKETIVFDTEDEL